MTVENIIDACVMSVPTKVFQWVLNANCEVYDGPCGKIPEEFWDMDVHEFNVVDRHLVLYI